MGMDRYARGTQVLEFCRCDDSGEWLKSADTEGALASRVPIFLFEDYLVLQPQYQSKVRQCQSHAPDDLIKYVSIAGHGKS